MLSPREKRLLEKELARVEKINDRARGNLLPEEKVLIKKEFPSGGIHVHDEDNPFGMHRHLLGDPIDGAHQHTTQNPGGEHIHGEFEGRALIDGSHRHKGFGDGYHSHKKDETNEGQIIPQKPEGIPGV